MKIEDVLTRSFKRLRHELGHDRPRDTRPMWLIRLIFAKIIALTSKIIA